MYRVSDEQIEFILNDIKKRGVEMEDLQLNLLDHICCILEQDYKEEQDFKTEYQKVIKQFFKHALWEIEEETILLLKYKNYYKMKRFLYILFVVSIGLNVYFFSKTGYRFYKIYKWQTETKILEKTTLKEGFEDFSLKLKKQNSKALERNYIYVCYIGDVYFPFLDEFDEEVPKEDSAQIKKTELHQTKRLLQADSLASIYGKNVSFIFAYTSDNNKIDQRITKSKELTRNIIYIKDVPKLLKGYENSKNQFGTFRPTIIILDKSGIIKYESTISTSFLDKKLINFLKETL